MKNKINIAELLKDCPKGMELDCTMYDNVTFERFDVEQNRCYFKAGPADTFWTTCYGKINGSPFGKCVIFPKGKTTWEGFQRPFVEGDIVTWQDRGSLVACIYKERKNTTSFYHHIALYNGGIGIILDGEIVLTDDELCFATEEEKAKLFDAIKANGYKWNANTKTLEKLPELNFKVGDIIQDNGYEVEIIEVNEENEYYKYKSISNKGIGSIAFSKQDDWKLVPTKFDINTLKPFDNCRYSLDGGRTWKFAQYWYIQDKYDVNEIEIDLWLN